MPSFLIAKDQPTSTYQDVGASSPYRIIKLIDSAGWTAEIRVVAEMNALPALHAEVMAMLAERLPTEQ